MKKALLLLATCAQCFGASYFNNNSVAPNGEKIHQDLSAYELYFGGAAQAGSSSPTYNSAIFYKRNIIKGWATGYKDLHYGTASSNTVADKWKTPEKSLGAVTTSEPTEGVVCLGDGGTITYTFGTPIVNGSGVDFAVFENGFDANYLELGYVEVSSDGVHFVRFPNFYLGETEVIDMDMTEAGDVYPEDVYNLASKYESGYGHGFDLGELEYAYNYALTDGSAFSDEYKKSLLDNFGFLDLNNVQYVKIIDIYGDGSCVDSEGHPIYDPTGPNNEAPGIDIKGIGVINTIPEPATYAALFGAAALALALRKRNCR